jgi:hypothetical protein
MPYFDCQVFGQVIQTHLVCIHANRLSEHLVGLGNLFVCRLRDLSSTNS